MNKRGFNFKGSMFALVAASLFIVATGVIIDQQSAVYNPDALSEIEGLNQIDELKNISSGYRTSLGIEESDPGDDAEASTFRAVYGIVTGIFSSIDLFIGPDGLIHNLMTTFGIPDYIARVVIALILISMTFGIAAVIFRNARRSI